MKLTQDGKVQRAFKCSPAEYRLIDRAYKTFPAEKSILDFCRKVLVNYARGRLARQNK